MAAAFTEANKALSPQARFLTGDNGQPIIYTDIRSEPMARYKKVTLQVPASTVVVNNILATPIAKHNLAATPTEVVLDYLPATGFVLGPLDELFAASPQQLRSAYVDETIKAMIRKVNGYITAQLTTGTFNVAGNVVGAANAGVTLGDFTKIHGVLAARDINVEDEGNLFFVANSQVYTNLLGQSAWADASKVSDSRAGRQIRTGIIDLTLGAIPLRDNQMPSSVAAGTRTSTSAYFHRHALAMVSAPLSPPEATVAYSYESFGPLTILIAIGYNQDTAEHTLTFHALCGVVPWRKDHMVLHTSTLAE